MFSHVHLSIDAKASIDPCLFSDLWVEATDSRSSSSWDPFSVFRNIGKSSPLLPSLLVPGTIEPYDIGTIMLAKARVSRTKWKILPIVAPLTFLSHSPPAPTNLGTWGGSRVVVWGKHK